MSDHLIAEANRHARALIIERDQIRAELAAEREKVTMLLSDAYALTKNWHDRAERAEAELAKYLSACPASPTEEERKRCQQWWAISGKSP